jgi:hypothetical protein
MLYFCEDCGEKNFLESAAVQNGTVTFRCQFCNYLNKLQVNGSAEDDTQKVPAQSSSIDADEE